MPADRLTKIVAENVQRHLDTRGADLSKRQWSLAAKLNPAYVSQLLRDEVKSIQLDAVAKLADAEGLDVYELLMPSDRQDQLVMAQELGRILQERGLDVQTTADALLAIAALPARK